MFDLGLKPVERKARAYVRFVGILPSIGWQKPPKADINF